MFKVKIHKTGKDSRFFIQNVSVDSLFEAELMALKTAAKHFKDTDIMLVHKGGLVYEIYETFEPIGSVVITTA